MNKLISVLFIVFVNNFAALHAAEQPSKQSLIWAQLTSSDKTKRGFKLSLSASPNDDMRRVFNEIFEKMLEKPYTLLKNNQELSATYKIGTQSYENLLAENPIFLLDECSREQCPITRKSDSTDEPRNYSFNIVEYLLRSMNKKDISVASFACGESFYDLTVLMKLHILGYNVKKLVLIDPIFNELKNFMSLQDTHTFDVDTVISRLQAMHLCEEDIMKIQRLHQFLTAASVLHKEIEFFVFRNAYEYINFDAANINADLIIALDHGFPADTIKQVFEKLVSSKTTQQGRLIDYIMFNELQAYVYFKTANGEVHRTLMDIVQ